MNGSIVRHGAHVALAAAICGLVACGSLMQAGPERPAEVASPGPAVALARAAAPAPRGAASTWLELNHEDCREPLKLEFQSCMPKQAVVAKLLRQPYRIAMAASAGASKPCYASRDCNAEVIVKVIEEEQTCTAEFNYPALEVNGTEKDKVVTWTLKPERPTVGTYAYAASGAASGVGFARRQPPSGTPTYMDPATMWSSSSSAASAAEGKMKFKPAASPHRDYHSACHYPIVDWKPTPSSKPIRCCPIDPIIINQP